MLHGFDPRDLLPRRRDLCTADQGGLCTGDCAGESGPDGEEEMQGKRSSYGDARVYLRCSAAEL